MYKSIPTELKHLKQWCCFKLQPRGDKLTKIPIDANTGGPGKSKMKVRAQTFKQLSIRSIDISAMGSVSIQAAYLDRFR